MLPMFQINIGIFSTIGNSEKKRKRKKDFAQNNTRVYDFHICLKVCKLSSLGPSVCLYLYTYSHVTIVKAKFLPSSDVFFLSSSRHANKLLLPVRFF